MRAAIVLAAGRSRRFGSANKLLVRWRARPLLHHALAAACAAPVGRVLVVAGADPRVARCVRAFGDARIRLVGPLRSASRAESLAEGLCELRANEREVFVFLGDMPLIDHCAAARLMRMGRSSHEAARPVRRAMPGHPVLLRDPATALERIERGEPPLDPETTALVAGAPAACLDVDRPAALGRSGLLR